MKILLIHNAYASFSGEEAVFEMQKELLESHGHEVEEYSRSSSELKQMPFGRPKAFFLGLKNRKTIREVGRMISGQMDSRTSGQADIHSQSSILYSPSIVHIHNLYPLISPAILPVIKKAGIPIVMTVHNYRLICPNGLFFTHGEICEKCAGGKEWNCIVNNCECSFFKSSGYALRNWFARINKFYLDNVAVYICLTEFQKKKLIENGYPAEKITVIANTINGNGVGPVSTGTGKYAAFAGRISREKGAHLIFEAARQLPTIQFKLAGKKDEFFISGLGIPVNIEFMGSLTHEELQSFYNNAAFLLLPSIWYEGFPIVTLEAMEHNLPVIAPRLAGFPEIIEEEFNGLLFQPGDANDLAKKIEMLWNDNELRTRLGENGRKKLEEQYSPEVYYRKLMAVYEEVKKK